MSNRRHDLDACRRPFYLIGASLALLNSHKIRPGPAEGFGMVHLLGLRRRHNKFTRGRSAGYIGIVIDTFPEESGDSLRTLVAEILMFEPVLPPPPLAIAVRAAAVCDHTVVRLTVGWYRLGRCQFRI